MLNAIAATDASFITYKVWQTCKVYIQLLYKKGLY